MQTEFSYKQFFELQSCSPQVTNLLRDCIVLQTSLRLRLGLAQVTLSVDQDPPLGRAPTLIGCWRSYLLESEHYSVEAQILAPFVFLIEELCLPHNSLISLGRNDRLMADLFMQNVFYAACRREQMFFLKATTDTSTRKTEGSRYLAKIYHWIAKAHFKNKIFDRNNAPELILACAHLPLMEFGNPLMDIGAKNLRLKSAQTETANQLCSQKLAFQQARERILNVYQS